MASSDGRRENWTDRALAERLSCSSFSGSPDDAWCVDVARPYQIVAMPGYEVPQGLDRASKDAIWVAGPVRSRTVAWDGFCPYALLEIIYECFDYDGPSDKIAVWDVEGERLFVDDRPSELMAIRPRRRRGMGRGASHNHMADLDVWSSMVAAADRTPAGTRTSRIYQDLFISGEGRYSVDGVQRSSIMNARGIAEFGYPPCSWNPSPGSPPIAPSPHPAIRMGDVSWKRVEGRRSRVWSDEDGVEFVSTCYQTRKAMRAPAMSELSRLSEAGGSLHALALMLGEEERSRPEGALREQEGASGSERRSPANTNEAQSTPRAPTSRWFSFARAGKGAANPF